MFLQELTSMSIHAILLAGGSSTRFNSPIPKVLYPFLDKPLIEHLIDSLLSLRVEKITIISGKRTDALLKEKYSSERITILEQKEPLGTLDAVKTALAIVKEESLLIINGDTPLIRAQFLQKIIEHPSHNVIAISHRSNPEGLGRVMLNKQGFVYKIIEQKHLKEQELSCKKVNAGIYKFQTQQFLNSLSLSFQTPEQYLTSSIGSYLKGALLCEPLAEELGSQWTLQGVNSFEELSSLESSYFQAQRLKALKQGAILKNSAQIFIYGHTEVSPGVCITGPCELRGNNILGPGAQVEPFSMLKDISLGNSSVIHSFSHLQSSQFGSQNHLGPYLRSRGNIKTKEHVHLGNFLEIKDLTIEEHTKAKHFGYLGNGSIGSTCNIGAGVVFCNYDGKTKQSTIIDQHVFVGASSQLIAPIKIGHSCYIGAGTVLSKNLSPATLAVRRATLKQTDYKKQLEKQGEK